MSDNPSTETATTPPPPPTPNDGFTAELARGDAKLTASIEALPRCERCAHISYMEGWNKVVERMRGPKQAQFPTLTPASKPRFVAAVVKALVAGSIEAAAARAMLYAAQLIPDKPAPARTPAHHGLKPPSGPPSEYRKK